MDLTKEQLFLALASEVPDGDKLVPNPYKKWSDVDKSLPDVAITVYGPPPTSGTRDAFVELAMHEGCKSLEYFKKKKGELDKDGFEALVKEKCTPMRQDGPFIEAGENDNLIVQRIEADPNALGIFGYSFLYENQDKLQGVKIAGVDAELRHHRRQQLRPVASAVHLHQERPSQGHPRHERVHRRVHQRRGDGRRTAICMSAASSCCRLTC